MSFTKTTAAVKSVIGHKGFGFLKDESDIVIFIHATVLEAADFVKKDLLSTSTIMVEVSTAADGRRTAERVLELDGKKANLVPTRKNPPNPPNAVTLQAGDHAVGTLLFNRKWDDIFCHEKGYGFVSIEDHIPIFVHISAIPADLQEKVFAGANFEFAVGETDRGLCANVCQLVKVDQGLVVA